jgi:site-specific DNA-methyltransferase (cytosine-N4-specific)
MIELADSSVDLMVTSPPYPMIKMWDNQFSLLNPKIPKLWKELENTGKEESLDQIFQIMHDSLGNTWREVFRVLVDGGIACINIGDATRNINGEFRLFPNHSKIIDYCEKIGFTSLPYILWKKPTTKPQYRGKNVFLGSGFLPPNAYVTLDCEFILIFRKGKLRKFQPKDKLRYESSFTKEQRNKWFSQIWMIKGIRQKISQVERKIAAFPEEIVSRLIRMFSIKFDTILDPFLGSGTTTKLALHHQRNSVGYEIDKKLLPLLNEKLISNQKSIKLQIINR